MVLTFLNDLCITVCLHSPVTIHSSEFLDFVLFGLCFVKVSFRISYYLVFCFARQLHELESDDHVIQHDSKIQKCLSPEPSPVVPLLLSHR